MGIRGLKWYLSKQCPDTGRRVQLRALAEDFRRHHSTVSVVVDGKNCTEQLYGRDADCNCGVQYMEMMDGIKRFVEAFKRLRIRLIFFYDGLLDDDKVDTWFKRRCNEIDEMKEIFQAIRAGNHNNAKKKCSMSSQQQLAIRVMYKDDPYVEIYTPVTGDVDRAIANYAKDNQCLAILSEDTDFIIYDTVPVLSNRELNLEDMTTTMSDQNKICISLGVRRMDMPILASLIGNDIVSDTQLRKVHLHLLQPSRYLNINNIIGAIIRFIAQQRANGRTAILDLVIDMVRKYEGAETANRFSISVRNYQMGNCDSTNFRRETTVASNHLYTVEFFKRQMIETNITTFIGKVIFSARVDKAMSLQDCYDATLIPCMLLFRPIRQRLYHIIFNSREIPKKNIQEIWVPFNKEHKTDNVEPLPVTVKGNFVSMTDLWRRRASPSINNRNFQMETILSCFGIVTPVALKLVLQIPEELRALCIVLNYMSKQPGIRLDDWEIEAFVVQAIVPNAKDVDHWKQLQFQRLESRGVHLAAIFNRGVTTYMDSLSVCGMDLDLALPWRYFDGKRFHFCYKRLKTQEVTPLDLCGSNVASENLMTSMMQFINEQN